MRRIGTLVVLALFALAASANGVLVSEHIGATDPLTEGWEPDGSGSAFSFPPQGIDDDGTPAWAVHDDAAIDDDNAQCGYHYRTSDAERADLHSNGWRLTAKIRLTTAPDSADDSCVTFRYAGGGRMWWFSLGTDEEDNVVLTNYPFGPFPVAEPATVAGANVYHTYVLEDVDNDDTAELYVDDVLLGTTRGYSKGHKWAGWGSLRPLETGSANYALVRLESLSVEEQPDGDGDLDGDVDDDDLSLLLAHWGQDVISDPDGGWGKGEFSEGSPINDDDLSLLLANWTGSQASAVPEPATMGLLAIGGLAMIRRKR